MKGYLIGNISWTVSSYYEDRVRTIVEEFDARDREAAVEKAWVIIENIHERWSDMTDYRLSVELRVNKNPWWKKLLSAMDMLPWQLLSRSQCIAHFTAERTGIMIKVM